MAFGIARQQLPGIVERRMIANGGKDVGQLAGVACGIAHPIRGYERQMKPAGDANGRTVAHFLLASEVPLELDIHIVTPENVNQTLNRAACPLETLQLESH